MARAEEYRRTQGRRLEYRVQTAPTEATADVSDVGQRVQLPQHSHLVDDHDLVGPRSAALDLRQKNMTQLVHLEVSLQPRQMLFRRFVRDDQHPQPGVTAAKMGQCGNEVPLVLGPGGTGDERDAVVAGEQRNGRLRSVDRLRPPPHLIEAGVACHLYPLSRHTELCQPGRILL